MSRFYGQEQFPDEKYWTKIAVEVGDRTYRFASPHHPVISEPTAELTPVELSSPEIHRLARDLKSVLVVNGTGVGLSAVQLGIGVRMFVARHDSDRLGTSPEVMKSQGRMDFEPIVLANVTIEPLSESEIDNRGLRSSLRRTSGIEGCLTVDAALRRDVADRCPQRQIVGRIDAPLAARVRGVILGDNGGVTPYDEIDINFRLRILNHENRHADGLLFTHDAKLLRTRRNYLDAGHAWRKMPRGREQENVALLRDVLPPSQQPSYFRGIGASFP